MFNFRCRSSRLKSLETLWKCFLKNWVIISPEKKYSRFALASVKETVLVVILRLDEYGWKLALNLLYYLGIEWNKTEDDEHKNNNWKEKRLWCLNIQNLISTAIFILTSCGIRISNSFNCNLLVIRCNLSRLLYSVWISMTGSL